MLINCRGTLLDLSKPSVMGILNLTPDSFYDGNDSLDQATVMSTINQLVSEQPEIIDIGGNSSRPGAIITSPTEEWNRIEFAITYIRKQFPNQLISIDTLHSKVASLALQAGCHIINDISGGQYDQEMMATVGQFTAPYVMMHMRKTPSEMQEATDYKHGVLLDIMSFYKRQLAKAKQHGIKDVVLDPGFGFAKTIKQNYELATKVETLRIFDCPILVGVSRKSMIYKVLGSSPKEALNGTSAMHMHLLTQGANILRVHDVREAKEVIKIYNNLKAG